MLGRFSRTVTPPSTPAGRVWVVSASLAVGLALCLVVASARASTSASLSASVPVVSQFKSIVVNATSESFGGCSGGSSSGNTLGYPNGTCATPVYTVTNNGSLPEGLDVTGSNATASDGGTGWSLIAGGATPGTNQYQLHTGTGLFLSTSPQCDTDVSGCSSTTQNSLQPGSTANEQLTLNGPSAASDVAATSFSSSITYTAV